MPVALIVDNDTETALLLSEILREQGYEPETAETLPKAREALSHAPEIAILSDSVDGSDTLSLLEAADLGPETEIYLMSSEPAPGAASRALRAGASDVFRKPVNRERLIRNLRSLARNSAGTSPPQGAEGQADSLLVGESRAMQRLHRLIRTCAGGDKNVFLAGESGTGKERIARAIHRMSPRANGEFVSLNCSALAPEQLEAELFGDRRSGGNGGPGERRGYFERATGGTVFLDDITEMNAGLQAKLSRVLESGEMRRSESEQPLALDVRIISATDIDPDDAVRRGRLREDLYYRLAEFPIRVPALRERGGDVLLLAEHFLGRCNAESGRRKRFSSKAREALLQYEWPGNVAELRSAVFHSHLLAENEIRLEDLPGRVTSRSPGDGEYVRLTVGTSLAENERRAIQSTLEHYEGDTRKTADVLGISLKTLYNRLKQYKDEDR